MIGQAATWRPVGAIALYAALGAVLAVGLAALLRHAAGVIAVLLLMPFVVEPLVGSLPEVGPRVGPLLPFVNAFRFTEVRWFQAFETHWGPWGALWYFHRHRRCGVRGGGRRDQPPGRLSRG